MDDEELQKMSVAFRKLKVVEEILELAKLVVEERQDELKHARESRNMVQLEKKLREYHEVGG